METNRLLIYQDRKLKPSKTWMLFLFLGWYYGSMDKMGLQILYYITLGGLGVWWLILLMSLSFDIKKYNLKIANDLSIDESWFPLIGDIVE